MLEELGPLFVDLHEPHYFWVLILIVSVPVVLAGVYVLVRGSLPVALSSAFLVMLPLFGYLLGDIHVLDVSKEITFCGSCHSTMFPLLDSLKNDDTTLAGLHYSRGAIQRGTACYSCHSGYGLTGDVSAKMSGLNHMLHTVLGTEDYPLQLRNAFDIDSCLDCHAPSKPFRAVVIHRDPGIQQMLVDRVMGCTGACHPSAHPPEALNGAAAWTKE